MRGVIRLGVLVLFAILVARIAATYRVFNDTKDEGAHIAAGLQLVEQHRYTLDRAHAPLGRLVLAIPPYLAGLRLQGRSELWNNGAWDQGSLEFFWRTLTLARAGNLVFAALLLLVSYLWAFALFGEWAGLAAAVLVTFCPNLMAHSSIATLDLAATATILLASYKCWRWTQDRSWKHCLGAAAACGFAVVCKFTAVFVLPPIVAGYFLVAHWRRTHHLFPSAVQSAAFVLVLAAIVWGTYSLVVEPFPPGGSPLARVAHRVVQPERELASGLRQAYLAVRQPEAPHLAYLLGEFSSRGWWYYFLVAVAVKTTLPLLLLCALGAGLFGARCFRGPAAESACLLIPVAVVLAVGAWSHFDVGVRHVLPLYAFLAILGSSLFAARDRLHLAWPRARLVLGLLLLTWHVAESVAAHPDYLAYFNEIARGREERFLLDSNLDWGQDLARLGSFLRDQDIPSVLLLDPGTSSPAKMGVVSHPFTGCEKVEGWVAVSISHLMTFLQRHPECAPVFQGSQHARVGKAIWLFRFSAARDKAGR